MNNINKQTGVYKITNQINGKIYIGSASHSFRYRWTKKYNSVLIKAFEKYGRENFKFEILLICDPEDCLIYEQIALDYYQPWVKTGKGYNICKVADSWLGLKHTEETKNKMSLAKLGKPGNRLGYKTTEETKQKQSLVRKKLIQNGWAPSEEHKKKISESLTKTFNETKTRYRAVERIDPETGEVKEYATLKMVLEDGFSKDCVWQLCNYYPDKLRKHKGYYWKYLDE